jgi:hypothetical protein
MVENFFSMMGMATFCDDSSMASQPLAATRDCALTATYWSPAELTDAPIPGEAADTPHARARTARTPIIWARCSSARPT